VGDFSGAGVWEYQPGSGWHQLTASDAPRLGVALGEVFGEFLGSAVWVLDTSWGWFRLATADAALLVVA
jgi:hypothetical protein